MSWILHIRRGVRAWCKNVTALLKMCGNFHCSSCGKRIIRVIGASFRPSGTPGAEGESRGECSMETVFPGRYGSRLLRWHCSRELLRWAGGGGGRSRRAGRHGGDGRRNGWKGRRCPVGVPVTFGSGEKVAQSVWSPWSSSRLTSRCVSALSTETERHRGDWSRKKPHRCDIPGRLKRQSVVSRRIDLVFFPMG